MIDISITDDQQIDVTLSPKAPSGRKVKVDGVPVWTVVSGSATVQPAADGLSAVLVSGDIPEVSTITVAADVDLGEGVDTITETINLTVVDPQASSLGVTAGTPTDKVTPPPAGPQA